MSSWLESDHPFHIMRDHPNHGVQVLAGMWGAKLNNNTRNKYKEMLGKIMKNVSSFNRTRKDKTLYLSLDMIYNVHSHSLLKF